MKEVKLTQSSLPNDSEFLFPGENWFFYWKTSFSLWRSKLAELPAYGNIIVPINWSFHSETGESYDFANTKPETNLKKLVHIAEELGKKIIFFLPLTPVPYLPNGGVPHLLARNVALNHEGMAYGIIDYEGNINKLFSFFDTRIFKSFGKFVNKLGQYFSENGIAADIWGIECGFFQNNKFYSFSGDSSNCFQKSFTNFLSAKKEEDLLKKDHKKKENIQSQEKQLIIEFNNVINDIYKNEASKHLSANWEGSLKICFLGGNNQDIFLRMSHCEDVANYSKNIIQSFVNNIIPSSILIPMSKKRGVLNRQLNEQVTNTLLENRLNLKNYEDDNLTHFTPLVFFEIFEEKNSTNYPSEHHTWEDLSLRAFLSNNYECCYSIKPSDEIPSLEESENSEKAYFILGESINLNNFSKILNLLMMGKKVILDISTLEIKLKQKLETFFLENSLEVETVNFHTAIHNVRLGEGQFIFFDGKTLAKKSAKQQIEFWNSIVETLEIMHLGLEFSDSLIRFWRTRPSLSHELNYEEIRRLSLYNPTSYKQRVKIQPINNFVIMKIVDEINTRTQSSPHELNLEILPEGSISVDFGVFS